MQVIKLSLEERIATGCSHVAIVDYTDLNTTAAANKTLTLFDDGQARDIIDKVFFDLVTPFDGGATSALKLDVGYNGASVDDADAFIDNIEIHEDATQILADAGSVPAPDTSTVDGTYGAEEDAVIDSLRDTANLMRARGAFAAQEAFDLEAVFTATGGNLTLLDTGRVRIYFNVIRPTELRNINDE